MSSSGIDILQFKQQETGTAKQEVHISVGSGLYEMISGTVYTNKPYVVPGDLGFVHQGTTATELFANTMQHGYASSKIGIDLQVPRLVEGPGYFVGTSTNLEADAITYFQLAYRAVISIVS